MNKFVKYFIDFYLYSSLHIAICCIALLAFTGRHIGFAIDFEYYLLCGFATLFIYGIHRLVGMQKVAVFDDKGRYFVIKRFRSHILVYTVIAFFATIYYYLHLQKQTQLLMIGPGIISLLYTLPIFGGKNRLRDFSFVKIFLIAAVWSLTTVTIPSCIAGIDPTLTWTYSLERFLFFIALTIPFDIRDLPVDKHIKVQTIPSLLGEEKARQLAIGIGSMAGLLQVALTLYYQMDTVAMFSLLLTNLTLLILVWNTKKIEHDYFYTGVLDGLMILPLVLWYLLQLWN